MTIYLDVTAVDMVVDMVVTMMITMGATIEARPVEVTDHQVRPDRQIQLARVALAAMH
ncbi:MULTISPECIES: hypothetical protein [Rhodoferax]|uniref:hypothetical protein n=1 Tax=Rhodoferax TaxID=28065 RepID=UPI001F5B2E23|nr:MULTISPECIES: hypothetical protein [Rhodoferax]